MKILYGITKSGFGGAQRYVFELATETKKRGHEVAVLCGGQGILKEKLKKEEVRIIPLWEMGRDIDVRKDILSFFKIFKILRQERPDVFHINSSKMGGIGSFTARLAGVKKIIFTSHGWAFNEPRPGWHKMLIKVLVWFTILLSHKTICVSKKTREDVVRWPFIRNKLPVIYNGIQKFELVQRENRIFTVGTLGELHRIKGLDILLEAWVKFVDKREARLVIVNDGEEKENLQNMAKKLDISGSIEFRGFVDNARSLLSTFDVFCQPSRSEAMPYAPLEAGLAGLPVIATSVGGVPEIIENGISGILIPPEDSETLLSSLILLYENPDLRERLGLALKETVEKNFPLENMVNKTLQIYL